MVMVQERSNIKRTVLWYDHLGCPHVLREKEEKCWNFWTRTHVEVELLMGFALWIDKGGGSQNNGQKMPQTPVSSPTSISKIGEHNLIIDI